MVKSGYFEKKLFGLEPFSDREIRALIIK